MIILGIDPGYAIVGIGVIEYKGNKFTPIYYGAITTPAGMSVPLRLQTINRELELLIDKYKPDAVSVEELFFNSNQKTAIQVAQARGVIIVTVVNKDIPLFEYTPLQIKQAMTGYGRATKQQMQQMVKMFLGLNAIPKPDDAADALAAAICHAHSANINDRFGLNKI